MPRRADPVNRRDREERFTANAAERQAITRAALYRKLKPATYMRKCVLDQVERDLADAAALTELEPAPAPAAPPPEWTEQLAQVAQMLGDLAEKLRAPKKS